MHGYQPTFTHTQTLYLTAKATFVVITFPVTLVFRSIKQVFASIVGYGVHTGVFMLGTYHSPMQKRIVEWIKQSSLNNPRGQAFDLNRLKKSFTLLENLGGHRTQLHPFDGGAKLEAIYFSREKIKEQIEEQDKSEMFGRAIESLQQLVEEEKADDFDESIDYIKRSLI